jgi:HAD superfamily hydrolase (TIGR01662 family)
VRELVSAWESDFPARYYGEDEVLDALRQARSRGWALGIVTNGQHQVQARKVAAAGLDVAVDTVCISGAEGIRKPDPQLFALAAERAGAELAGGWMIGDDPDADIGGARTAGLSTVWLRRGRRWPTLDYAADQHADTAAEAIALVLARAT